MRRRQKPRRRRGAKSYSLHFGFNYPNTDYTLNGCYNDAKMMRLAARKMGIRRNKVILDTRPISKARILQEIKKLIRKPNGSKLFLTYSGHGASVKAKNDAGERDGKNETLVIPSGGLIHDGEIYALIRKLPSRSRLLVVFDCCHSGTGCDFPLILNIGANKWTVDRRDTLLPGKKGAVMISGCTDRQYSYENVVNNKVRGALTNAFYRAVSRKTKSRRSRSSFNYLNLIKTIRNIIKDPKQTPLMSSTRYINSRATLFKH